MNFMGKSTISMVIVNSFLYVCQRVHSSVKHGEIPGGLAMKV